MGGRLRRSGCAAVLAFVAAAVPEPAVAQALEVGVTRRASKGGSFLVTVAGASAGAFTGWMVGQRFAPPPRTGGDCLTGTGPCGAPTGSDFEHYGFIVATTALGAAGGAALGRRLTGGRQAVLASAFGAGVGILTGAWIAAHLEASDPLPFAVSIAIPTGFFATLSGW